MLQYKELSLGPPKKFVSFLCNNMSIRSNSSVTYEKKVIYSQYDSPGWHLYIRNKIVQVVTYIFEYVKSYFIPEDSSVGFSFRLFYFRLTRDNCEESLITNKISINVRCELSFLKLD